MGVRHLLQMKYTPSETVHACAADPPDFFAVHVKGASPQRVMRVYIKSGGSCNDGSHSLSTSPSVRIVFQHSTLLT